MSTILLSELFSKHTVEVSPTLMLEEEEISGEIFVGIIIAIIAIVGVVAFLALWKRQTF